jgi:outer membrane lipopolysaccharide assembly protein LptE/RlpB
MTATRRPSRRREPERGAARRLGARALLLAVACGVLAGCGIYSTRPGALPAHIKTIAVPTFENRTVTVGLDESITDAVTRRFLTDNNLKVVALDEADAVLYGAVVDYRNTVFGFTAGEVATEYRVSITVAARLVDRVKNREIWRDEGLVKTHNYYVVSVPGQVAQDEISGREEAITKIADEILTRTVENW